MERENVRFGKISFPYCMCTRSTLGDLKAALGRIHSVLGLPHVDFEFRSQKLSMFFW